jgi:hypothetical protein
MVFGSLLSNAEGGTTEELSCLRHRLRAGTDLEAAIVTRPGNAGELAEMLNVNSAGVRCRHGFDNFREAGAIEPCRSAVFKARKAL